MTEDDTVLVSERKFNGTATFEVYDADTRKEAKAFARRFWKEEYGTKLSHVVAEEVDHYGGRWNVMVADQSSGSLKKNKEYEKP